MCKIYYLHCWTYSKHSYEFFEELLDINIYIHLTYIYIYTLIPSTSKFFSVYRNQYKSWYLQGLYTLLHIPGRNVTRESTYIKRIPINITVAPNRGTFEPL
jgi:hypothetical protein